MPLEQQLNDLLKQAMKEKDQRTIDAVRMLKTRVMERRTAKGFSGAIDDALVVDVIAALPGVVERLTAEHTPDRHGRCRVCTVAGHGVAWPCTLSVLAAEAAETRQRRR